MQPIIYGKCSVGVLPTSYSTIDSNIVTGSGLSAATTEQEIKTRFNTPEGVYKLMPLAEYSRPNRVPLTLVINTSKNVKNIFIDKLFNF